MRLTLASPDETLALGRALGDLFSAYPPIPVLFYGSLGAGKTTLVSALAAGLPGGDKAETSSPSFTLCNMYPTTPPIAHFDLYRQEDTAADETLLDFLDGDRHLVLVEWAERLPAYALPKERLACELTIGETGRVARFIPHGPVARGIVAALRSALPSHPEFSGVTP